MRLFLNDSGIDVVRDLPGPLQGRLRYALREVPLPVLKGLVFGLTSVLDLMGETVSPLDAGLAWTVSMNTDRDFVGKSALTAAGQQKQFLGLILLDKGVLRGHQKVMTPQGDGEITSGSFSPTLQQSIALARLPLGVQIGDEVEVDIRGKALKAKVTKPVFARNGKAVI